MASVRTLGPHPADKELVAVRKGRFGPYVQHGKTVANLPRGVMMDDVTLDEAVALLAEKGKTLKPRGAARGRKAATRKAARQVRCAGHRGAGTANRRGQSVGQARGGGEEGRQAGGQEGQEGSGQAETARHRLNWPSSIADRPVCNCATHRRRDGQATSA